MNVHFAPIADIVFGIAEMLPNLFKLGSLLSFSSKENQSLAVEVRKLDERAQAFARSKIEHDYIVLRHTIELAVRPESKPARFFISCQRIWGQNANKMAINLIILADRG